MKGFLASLFYKSLVVFKGQPIRYFYSGDTQILMFHRVVTTIGNDRIVNDGIEITEEYLEFLIRFYLKNSYTPISISELGKIKQNKTKQKYIIFTFDDGYYDNYKLALPIFEKYNIPFVVYITTDFIFRNQFAWWYFLEDLIKEQKRIEFIQDGKVQTITVDSFLDKINAFVALRDKIQTDISVLDFLLKKYPNNMNKYYNLFLNIEQLISFSNHPLVCIGSHSVSHLSLARVETQIASNEIIQSKQILEHHLNKKVNHFAYPFGTPKDVTNREFDLVKEAGYLTGITTNYGDVHFRKMESMFNLPRIWTSTKNDNKALYKSVFGYNEFLKKIIKY